jgi:hypothetical protein
MARLKTIDEVIKALGGSGAVAEKIGVAGNTVSTWRRRGIPAWACGTMQQECEEQKVDADPDLFRPRRRALAA